MVQDLLPQNNHSTESARFQSLRKHFSRKNAEKTPCGKVGFSAECCACAYRHGKRPVAQKEDERGGRHWNEPERTKQSGKAPCVRGVSGRQAHGSGADPAAQKRLYRLALPLRLRRRDPAGYPLPAARYRLRLRLPYAGEAGPKEHCRAAVWQADSHRARRRGFARLRRLALPLRLRRRGACAAPSAARRLPKKLRLFVPSAAKGLYRQTLWAAYRNGICRQAKRHAPLALPLRLRRRGRGGPNPSANGQNQKLRLPSIRDLQRQPEAC